jgi:DNA-binding HxlR family transcriptional regulator
MLERTQLTQDDPCPVEAVAEVIGQKWTSLILRDLSDGAKRFGELLHSVKASPRVLSARLQELERQGVVNRQVFAEVPPRTTYTLTEKGQQLVPLIHEMRRVGRYFLEDK